MVSTIVLSAIERWTDRFVHDLCSKYFLKYFIFNWHTMYVPVRTHGTNGKSRRGREGPESRVP